MDFANGGSLRYHHNKRKRFYEEEVQFYAAEILLALEYLHNMGYMYRDLKMENILLDSEGHIKLVDFGISKKIPSSENEEVELERTNTFWGTLEYLAPEVKSREQYDKSVDFYSLGVLIHTMLYGKLPEAKTPLREENEDKDAGFADYMKTTDTEENSSKSPADYLISNLLEPNPRYRLGRNEGDFVTIKNWEFFSEIDWEALENREVEPPFVPDVAHDHDTSYFDRKLTSLTFDQGVCQTIVLE